MSRYSIVFFIGFLITGCHFSSQYLDEESEKEAAEKITSKFYELVKTKQFTKAEVLFNEEFFTVTSRKDLQNLFVNTQKILGNYESSRIIEWKTKRSEGAISLNQYLLIYEVEYQHYKAKETIDLIKEGNVIKIRGYNINSNGFLK